MAMELVTRRPAGCSTAPLYPPSDSDDDDVPSLVLLPKDRANAVARHVTRVRGTGTQATPASPDKASPAHLKCCQDRPMLTPATQARESRRLSLSLISRASSLQERQC
jgi:hypothetical protein